MLALAVLCFLLFTLSLSSYWRLLLDGLGLVQIRNSFNFLETVEINWPPSTPPAWFRRETHTPSAYFVDTGQQFLAGKPDSDLALTVDIVRKLHTFGLPKDDRIGGRVGDTYKQITSTGCGYCADYTKVFLAIAKAVGLQHANGAYLSAAMAAKGMPSSRSICASSAAGRLSIPSMVFMSLSATATQ